MYVVSACLAGIACRYDARAMHCPEVLMLVAEGRALAVCPEVLGGLATPRTPSEIVHEKVITKDGQDVTTPFMRGAQKALQRALKKGCTAAILKSRSPSCGRDSVYDGTFTGTLVSGQGVFAKMLQDAGLRIYTEEDLPTIFKD